MGRKGGFQGNLSIKKRRWPRTHREEKARGRSDGLLGATRVRPGVRVRPRVGARNTELARARGASLGPPNPRSLSPSTFLGTCQRTVIGGGRRTKEWTGGIHCGGCGREHAMCRILPFQSHRARQRRKPDCREAATPQQELLRNGTCKCLCNVCVSGSFTRTCVARTQANGTAVQPLYRVKKEASGKSHRWQPGVSSVCPAVWTRAASV